MLPFVAQGQITTAEFNRLFPESSDAERAQVIAFKILKRCNWSGCGS